ncbi:MAG TPA: PAS domain S-box protein [bacterium]|nr:PAS domain S-box protein [bacterium]
MNNKDSKSEPALHDGQLKEEIKELRTHVEKLEKQIETLEHSEKRFSVLFHEAIDALVVIDGESAVVLRANKAACELLGYREKELTGKPFTSLLAQESQVPVPLSREDVRFYNTVFVQTFHKSDGKECEMDLTFAMVPWDDKTAILTSFRDVSERVRAEKEREKLIRDLQEAMEKIKTLRGLIPICAHCKKIRDDEGYWQQVEVYVRDHTEAQFSHGICPDCMRSLYPELSNDKTFSKET